MNIRTYLIGMLLQLILAQLSHTSLVHGILFFDKSKIYLFHLLFFHHTAWIIIVQNYITWDSRESHPNKTIDGTRQWCWTSVWAGSSAAAASLGCCRSWSPSSPRCSPPSPAPAPPSSRWRTGLSCGTAGTASAAAEALCHRGSTSLGVRLPGPGHTEYWNWM